MRQPLTQGEPPRRLNFLITQRLYDALMALKARDGVLPAESIRRALESYLRSKGVLAAEKGAKGKQK